MKPRTALVVLTPMLVACDAESSPCIVPVRHRRLETLGWVTTYSDPVTPITQARARVQNNSGALLLRFDAAREDGLDTQLLAIVPEPVVGTHDVAEGHVHATYGAYGRAPHSGHITVDALDGTARGRFVLHYPGTTFDGSFDVPVCPPPTE